MSIERAIRILAGVMILLSLGLAYSLSAWWLLLTAFVGLNLFQSGFSGWCPAIWIFERIGLPHVACRPNGNLRGR